MIFRLLGPVDECPLPDECPPIVEKGPSGEVTAETFVPARLDEDIEQKGEECVDEDVCEEAGGKPSKAMSLKRLKTCLKDLRFHGGELAAAGLEDKDAACLKDLNELTLPECPEAAAASKQRSPKKTSPIRK